MSSQASGGGQPCAGGVGLDGGGTLLAPPPGVDLPLTDYPDLPVDVPPTVTVDLAAFAQIVKRVRMSRVPWNFGGGPLIVRPR